jgi:aryl-alcohol dehydrogenase-like predicted oxidoreductase
MINRREFLGITAGAGATLALTPDLLSAIQAFERQAGKLIQRAIPSTGEKLPVIALGFANHATCADPAALKAVLKTFYDNGGRFLDTNHGNSPGAQDVPAKLASDLGIQDKLFWSPRAIVGGGGRTASSPEAVKAHFESMFTTFKVQRLDLVMGYPDGDPAYWAVLKEARKAGRVRYLGTMVSSYMPFPQVESVMRNEPLDFIAVDYSVERRDAEEKILPLALERKIGVMAFFPFGGANGASCVSDKGIFARVANVPVPEWAAEFDAKTWAQFFLKYVISHPAITTVRVGTTKPEHMLDDIAGGIGRLPNEATRKRMAAFIDSLPLPVPAPILDRYVGEYQSGSGLIVTFRREGERLLVKSGTNPELPLVASTPRRFSDSRGSVFEFQVAVTGPPSRATGVIIEQGGAKLLLDRR